MSKEKVQNVLEVAYQSLATESTEAMVAVFTAVDVEVGKDFIQEVNGLIYDRLIMKVE